ncbi:alpha/beta fold hydrolase [Streptomyces hygroscopicus]|uniref:alpha/beta fold hydrolase n=1 Tax=Streptomyces hygroscopicus TaxID=1912 RepID=UPI001FCA7E7F|nr:alpha/beta fold hydrolase [Streptomyces hygroscopicus]
MDVIRAALGERKISFLGHSYGTLIGRRYAGLYPHHLRALALDSAMDPARLMPSASSWKAPPPPMARCSNWRTGAPRTPPAPSRART